jgi:hypothetical protein
MAKKNPVFDAPTSARDLTKPFLAEWFKAHGTEEDKIWYVSLVANTPKVKKTNNLTKEEYETDDMKTIRKAVIDKYFPHLKKEKKKANEPKKTYEEELREALGL